MLKCLKEARAPHISPTGVIIKRRSGEIPCPLAVEAFAAHLSYICRYDDKYSRCVWGRPLCLRVAVAGWGQMTPAHCVLGGSVGPDMLKSMRLEHEEL